MKNLLARLLDRLAQPSTIAGLGAFGILLGVSPEVIALTGKAVIGVAGLAGVFLDENKVRSPDTPLLPVTVAPPDSEAAP